MKSSTVRIPAFALAAFCGFAACAQADQQQQFSGFVYEVLDGIGTSDEGPVYYLQQMNGVDLVIVKKSKHREEDSALQKWVGKKATLEGTQAGQSVLYERIGAFEPAH